MKTRQVDRIINALSNDIKISESYCMYEIMFLCVVEIEKYVMH